LLWPIDTKLGVWIAYIKRHLGIAIQVSVIKVKVTVTKNRISVSAHIKRQLGIAPHVSVIKVNVFSFHVITWVCFDLSPNLLSGSFGLPLRYLVASSRSFAYNIIFSFYSITSVHFDQLIAVTSKLGRWKPGFRRIPALLVTIINNNSVLYYNSLDLEIYYKYYYNWNCQR
jgi:hypothetical protein